MTPMPSRERRWLIAAVLTLLLSVGAVFWWAWQNRWHLSRRAVEIADPSVRAWATETVSHMSDGVYRLSVSPIRVDETRRRVAIDSLTLTTDSLANTRRTLPLPRLTMRLERCAVEGIDLTRLASGRGLLASLAGCSTVTLESVPSPGAGVSAQSGTSHDRFLQLRHAIDLPGEVPDVAIDSVVFPAVQFTLETSSGGRPSRLQLDGLRLRLDSFHIARHVDPAVDGPLLSRDVTVALDRFIGSGATKHALSFDQLRANLVRGTLAVEHLDYHPMSTPAGDSLGIDGVRARAISLAAVDWRELMISGNLRVGAMTVDSPEVDLSAPHHTTRTSADGTTSIATTLRSLGRAVTLDTLTLNTLRIATAGSAKSGSIIALDRLQATGLALSTDSGQWRGPLPLGAFRIDADGLSRQGSDPRVTVARVSLDARAARVEAQGVALQSGVSTTGRNSKPFRHDELRINGKQLRMSGVDVPAFLERGELRGRSVHIDGFALDVLSDHRVENLPGLVDRNRTPQQFVRAMGLQVAIDTVVVVGEVNYRERDADRAEIGVLRFASFRATMRNLSNDSTTMTAATPFTLRADAQLMGSGPLHLEVEAPLLDRKFTMRWRGNVGPIDAVALNPFIANTSGLKFTAGRLASASFSAVVTDGEAVGEVIPRWSGLRIDMPATGNDKRGFFAGLKRGVAKFAANSFVIRTDNQVAPGSPAPKNGVIKHRWTWAESLPNFFWLSLRDGLLPLLRH